MFTGIIEEVGKVKVIKQGSKSAWIEIEASVVMGDLKIGDSVATNGVCLTVVDILANGFVADIMNETLKRSSLGKLRQGSFVNLERALPINGRFGGHIVSGHIDGTGVITRITKDDIAHWYYIRASKEILRYIVEKGSIAIDGISLTVAEVSRDYFCVSIIPHTKKETTLFSKKVGDIVNLENDIIGKYIEKLQNSNSQITKEFLNENGF